MKKTPRAFWIGITFCTLLFLYFLLSFPTFDLDESLYRRVSEEMKLRGGDLWNPTWDSRPLLHKPPIFYWLIQFFSSLLDGASTVVSSTAARLPGFVAAIVMTFALGWQRSTYLWMAAFPLLTVCSVILDPLQTLALLPAILIPNRWFREEREGKTEEYLTVAVSLFAAAALKGLNGILIPSLAIAIQLGLQHRGRIFANMVRSGMRFTLKSFLPAVVLTTLYYFWLDQKMGHAFTTEFFWVHHFGRSQEAMESHGGGFWYYPLVTLIGCGVMLPFLVSAIASLKSHASGSFSRAFAREGYPLTFALSFILVFSFSATKLPHYLWPIWPALAIFIAGQERPDLSRNKLFFAFVPVLLLTAAAIFLALSPIAMIQEMSGSRMIAAILPLGYSIPMASRVGLALAAIVGAFILVKRANFAQHPETTFAVSSFFYLLFAVSTGPVLIDRIQKPIEAIATDFNALNPPPGTCIWYSGPHSPSLSLAMGYRVLHNRCEPSDMTFLIAPNWKIHECAERGMIPIAHEGYLNLCEKQNPQGVGAVTGTAAIDITQIINQNIAVTGDTEPSALLATTEAPTGNEGASAPADSATTTGATSVAGETATAATTSGADGIAGTADDLATTQLAGPDGTLGTEDDVVSMTYTGPDLIAGTEDDLPATASSAARPPVRSKKKTTVTHLGLKNAGKVEVMNFVGADGIEGTADDVVVLRGSGADNKVGTPDDQVVTQLVGQDKVAGTADDVVITQTVGPDKTAGTEDDIVVTHYAGPDKIAGTDDDVPTQAAPRAKKPKVTHIGLGTENETTVMNFAGDDELDGTADDVAVTWKAGPDKKMGTRDDVSTTVMAGADKIVGTEDDITTVQYTGPDKIAGTADDVVVTQLVGADKIPETEDDIPLMAAATGVSAPGTPAGAKAIAQAKRSAKKPKVTHIGAGTANEAVVMTFAGPDNVDGTADDITVTRPAKSSKPAKTRIRPLGILATYAGPDKVIGSEDDIAVTQTVGADKIAGTPDDVVVTQMAGPDKISGTEDDIPLSAREMSVQDTDSPAGAGTHTTTRPRPRRSGKVTHVGLGKNSEATVMNFAGPDDIMGTADDVVVTNRVAQKGKTKTKEGSPITVDDFVVEQLVGMDKAPGTLDDLVVVRFAGPDKVLGTADDVTSTNASVDNVTVTQEVGPDRIAGTVDDVLVSRSAGPDKKMGTADDVIVTRAMVTKGSIATTEGTQPSAAGAAATRAATTKAAATKADTKPTATKAPPVSTLFPKPATTPAPRVAIKKISSPESKVSPEKVKKIMFERNTKIVQVQVEKMDFCEAYLCDDKFKSERVLENLESLIDEFPDQKFKPVQLEMLNTSLVKAIEYKRNWQKYTPEYEIGLMNQEQVNDNIDPLISRLRAVISELKKR